MASENRVGPLQFETFPWVNTQAATTIAKGELFSLGGGRSAFAIEAMGTNTQARSTTFPGGNKAAACISSELAVIDKGTAAGDTFAAGAAVFYDPAVDANGLISAANATTSTFIVGLVETAATTSATTVSVATFHGGTPDTN